jgi:hypothetical protein
MDSIYVLVAVIWSATGQINMGSGSSYFSDLDRCKNMVEIEVAKIKDQYGDEVVFVGGACVPFPSWEKIQKELLKGGKYPPNTGSKNWKESS